MRYLISLTAIAILTIVSCSKGVPCDPIGHMGGAGGAVAPPPTTVTGGIGNACYCDPSADPYCLVSQPCSAPSDPVCGVTAYCRGCLGACYGRMPLGWACDQVDACEATLACVDGLCVDAPDAG